MQCLARAVARNARAAAAARGYAGRRFVATGQCAAKSCEKQSSVVATARGVQHNVTSDRQMGKMMLAKVDAMHETMDKLIAASELKADNYKIGRRIYFVLIGVAICSGPFLDSKE